MGLYFFTGVIMQLNSKSTILLIIRIFLGLTFIAHGGQKLFGWFGGPGVDGFINYLAGMNVPEWMAYAAILSEFLGGIMVLFGIAIEVGALSIVGNMIGAIYLVHGQHGFFIQNSGYEYALCLLILAGILVLCGPGEYYVWDPIKSYRD